MRESSKSFAILNTDIITRLVNDRTFCHYYLIMSPLLFSIGRKYSILVTVLETNDNSS